MDSVGVRGLFDAQVRRNTSPDGSGVLIERDQHVVRSVPPPGRGWSGITWSDLDESCADDVIAAQVGYFADRGQRFEWKLYDYDQPADLASRLMAAGFTAEDEETLMVTAVGDVPGGVPLPDGLRVLPVTGETGVGMLMEVGHRVFGGDRSQLRQSLLAQLDSAPEMTAMAVVMAGDQPVCSARIEFLPGSVFAGLWGGGTLPAWRRRGLYRALVAYRAELAAARDYRFLHVDASPDSRPVLERLGFTALARTTPFVWAPDASS